MFILIISFVILYLVCPCSVIRVIQIRNMWGGGGKNLQNKLKMWLHLISSLNVHSKNFFCSTNKASFSERFYLSRKPLGPRVSLLFTGFDRGLEHLRRLVNRLGVDDSSRSGIQRPCRSWRSGTRWYRRCQIWRFLRRWGCWWGMSC